MGKGGEKRGRIKEKYVRYNRIERVGVVEKKTVVSDSGLRNVGAEWTKIEDCTE